MEHRPIFRWAAPGLYLIGYRTGKIILNLPPFLISNEEFQERKIQMKNKHISVAAKRNITLNFPALDIPRSIGRKAGISK